MLLVLAYIGSSRVGALLMHRDFEAALGAGGALASPGRFPTAGLPPVFVWLSTGLNYWDSVVLGLAFAMLIGGALEAVILPARRVEDLFARRGLSGAAFGSLLGTPLMMCAACSVPPALAYWRRGASLETTLAVIHGSALLNFVGVATILIVFPWPIGVVRVMAGLAGALILVPLVARAARHLGDRSEVARPAPVKAAVRADPMPARVEPWPSAIRGAVEAWWWRAAGVTVRMLPLLFLAGFVAAAIRLAFPAGGSTALLAGGILVILLVAALGTLLAVPALLEIPLVFGLFLAQFSEGVGYGPAAALLVATPAASIVTFGMLYRDMGWRVPALLMAGSFVLAVAAGLAAEAISAWG